MKGLGSFAVIIFAGLSPLIILGMFGVVFSGVIGWRPEVLWTDSLASETTSVAAYQGGLFVAGIHYVHPPYATAEFFLRRYDVSHNKLWNVSFGNQFPDTSGIPTLAVGTDGVYLTAIVNSTTQVRKYDFQGNQLWTRQFPHSWIMISAGATDLYVAGEAFQNNTDSLFVSKYDSAGINVWSYNIASSSLIRDQYGELTSVGWGVNAIYAGPSAVFVGGHTSKSLSGQTMVDTIDGYVVMYDFNGNRLQTDEFAADSTTGISGNGNTVYATGTAGLRALGFIRKYTLERNLVWVNLFKPHNSRSVSSSIASADSSGPYLSVESSPENSLIRYDSDGNQLWSLDGAGGGSIAATSTSVYLAGGAGVVELSAASTLVLFGLNPPYSFLVLASLITAPAGILFYRELHNKSGLISCKSCHRLLPLTGERCRYCGALQKTASNSPTYPA